jgi:hypothetical protein
MQCAHQPLHTAPYHPAVPTTLVPTVPTPAVLGTATLTRPPQPSHAVVLEVGVALRRRRVHKYVSSMYMYGWIYGWMDEVWKYVCVFAPLYVCDRLIGYGLGCVWVDIRIDYWLNVKISTDV